MAVSQTKPNLAKETGGNLATISVMIQSMEKLVAVQMNILVELKLLNLQIAAMTGNPVPSDDNFISN